MVMRPTNLPRSSNSKDNNNSTQKAAMRQNPNRSRRVTPTNSPDTPHPPVRSRSLQNGLNRSPSKWNNASNKVISNQLPRSRSDKSPHGNQGMVLVRSRGSDRGSTDYLEKMSSKSTDSMPSTPEDNINVVIRVRPQSEKERRGNDEMVVQFPGNGQILCEGITTAQNPKLFSYNVVFETGATQDDVLQYSGVKRLIDMAIEGFSCTAFCYGQTGSGKTHTLTGPPDLFIGKPNVQDGRHGLIFRAFLYLFETLQERKDTNFILKASFLEIYNEKVIDLLNPGTHRKPLLVRWSKKSRGFFVENLFTVDCEELDDLMAVLEEGMRNRSVGSHSMNDYSSRSHTILTVRITSEQQAEGGVFISKQGKINFVDLAGSEMTKKTHSEGKTLEEANNINKSLMVLGYCIASLSDSKRRSGHIPYRDSQLTKLLADSLAGNGVTLMIACVSPARSNITETLNTLRYAARAKKIRTKPIIIMDPREALILSLKREVNALQQENEHLKSALNFSSDMNELNMVTSGSLDRRIIKPAPKIDLDKVTELEGGELVELVKLYMAENESLRSENNELYTTKEIILRDQEVVCRENERLLKKLEDVNSVCCRSPIIPARPAFSAEMLNMSASSDTEPNIWTNPRNSSADGIKDKEGDLLGGRVSANDNRIPDSIQKELDKRRLGENIVNIANSLRRHNSWESRSSSGSSQKMKSKGHFGNTNSTTELVESSSQSSLEKTPSPHASGQHFFGSPVATPQLNSARLF